MSLKSEYLVDLIFKKLNFELFSINKHLNIMIVILSLINFKFYPYD